VRQVPALETVGGDAGERVDAAPNVGEFRRRQIEEWKVHTRRRKKPCVDSYELFAVWEWQRPKQYRINDRENRRIRPDPKRERQNGGDREAGSLPQRAQRVSHVLPPRLDRGQRLQFPSILAQERRVAELTSRSRSRLLFRHALRQESLG
jgi:hypothetical protein